MKRNLVYAVLMTALALTAGVLILQLRPPSQPAAPQPIVQYATEQSAASYDEVTEISVLTENGTRTMSLHAYLLGVLPAEMPTSFAMEAQKAQAVAARTFTLKITAGGKHDGAICTDSHCCQAWLDPETLTDEARSVSEAAISQTDGSVLEYQGKLIDALFFSCSGGRTEDAVAVWGNDVAYLQSVESAGEEDAAVFSDEKRVSREELEAAFGPLPDDTDRWFGNIERTQGDGVATIQIGEETYTGVEVRKALSLRSTNFTVEVDDGEAVFSTLGYGHRVGMSQYGANAMAQSGADYEEILHHYYQDVTINHRRA